MHSNVYKHHLTNTDWGSLFVGKGKEGYSTELLGKIIYGVRDQKQYDLIHHFSSILPFLHVTNKKNDSEEKTQNCILGFTLICF